MGIVYLNKEDEPLDEPLTYRGSEPIYEDWFDNDTFLITFSPRVEKEIVWGDEEKFVKQLYAEVHTDEDNKVVIGENWYEVTENGVAGDYVDAIYEFDDMSQELEQKIKDYALERLKSYQE